MGYSPYYHLHEDRNAQDQPGVYECGSVAQRCTPDDYETFEYPSPSSNDACKTGQRSYNGVVTDYLMSIKYHLGEDVSVRSDGCRHKGWTGPAVDFLAAVFPDS